ncbi:MAG: outer membrane protein assembly factor BamE domain-containing protein [Planctomycetota bacterium]|jgi:outer membrane protein assembly factor BamE (lipoprotein component of BamABCDE complex)
MNKLYLIIFAVVIVVIAGTIIFLMIDRTPSLQAQIAKASAEFKENQYFRYESAKKLVPQLKIGMTTKEVEALLGKPNKKHDNDLRWDYTLGYSQFISVGFDSNGIVQKFGGAHADMQIKENNGK